MKKTLLLGLLCFSLKNINAQVNIAAARSAALGSNVTIKGTVTNSGELGGIRFIQDASGAVPLSGQTLTLSSIVAGDSLLAVGTLTTFQNELLVINWTHTVLATSRPLPAPQIITPNQLNETKEGLYVRINNCTFLNSGTFGGGITYTISSNTQTTLVYSSSLSDLYGMPIPTTQVDIIGIASQACSSPTVGCTTGYRLRLMNQSEMILSGMKENKFDRTLSIYPNPTNGMINFKLGYQEEVVGITIADVVGKVVFQTEKNTSIIDASHLPNGVYSITVNSNKHQYQSKFVMAK